MAKSTATCNSLLALILNAVAWANIAYNAASGPFTNLYVSLHTASPGVGNAQTTNETAYTNYTRIAVVRTTSGWSVPASAASSNVAAVTFPTCGVTGATITHAAIGTASSGSGTVLYAGALSSSLAVTAGMQPTFAIAALAVSEA